MKKIKIALIIDFPDWAFDNISTMLIKKLGADFEFKRIYSNEFAGIFDIFMYTKDCDILHFMWRMDLLQYLSRKFTSRLPLLGYSKNTFFKEFLSGKRISTWVCDHLHLDDGFKRTSRLFNDLDILHSYAVSSNKLKAIYDNHPKIRLKPSAVLTDGVDLNLFKARNLDRLLQTDRPVRIGWAGNSKWKVNDLKGINTIIRPAIEELYAEGYPVELITSDRNNGFIPHEAMPDFYAELDCYVCASLSEGTPNPILEAMACGVPCISTDVGIVSDVFGPEQKNFILEERSVVCLKQKIKKLLEDRSLLKTLSDENQKSIVRWDWTYKADDYRKYFLSLLNQVATL